MSREDPDAFSPLGPPRLICDVTQSWSERTARPRA